MFNMEFTLLTKRSVWSKCLPYIFGASPAGDSILTHTSIPFRASGSGLWFASMPVTTPTSKNYNKKKKQSTFTEAQHVSFSYIVLMRPRNVETMIPSDNTRGLMFPANVDSKVGSTGNGSLSSNVCERRTSTGGEPFSLLICRDATKFALLRLRANERNNSQHCCANNVGSCCVCVGSGVQTDATTPNNVGTCSASWEGYNQKAFVNHAYWACVAPTMLEKLYKRIQHSTVFRKHLQKTGKKRCLSTTIF